MLVSRQWLRQRERFWRVTPSGENFDRVSFLLFGLGLFLFLFFSVLFMFWGKVNADEGWYLYAGKMVYRGYFPYRDFAFTQTPLLPYIYGFVQLISSGIAIGRLTSVFFSLLAFFLSFAIATRFGGRMAGGVSAILWGTFVYGIYFHTIVKTYALTTFFISLTIFVWSLDMEEDKKIILSSISLLLGVLTRLSVLFFAFPFLFDLIKTRKRAKIVVGVVYFVAALWVMAMVLPNPRAAIWGLVTYHTSLWGDLTLWERASEVVKRRLPLLLKTFLPYWFVYAMLLLGNLRSLFGVCGAYWKPFCYTTVGLILFMIPNLGNGEFYYEYFVPFFFASFPVLSVGLMKILRRELAVEGASGAVLRRVLLLSAMILTTIMILGMLHGGISYVRGNSPPIAIKAVSRVVTKYTAATERVFALEALYVVVESDREVLPGMTMAQFSLCNADEDMARRLHLVNGEILLKYLQNSEAKVVLLTRWDWHLLRPIPQYVEIREALVQHYVPLLREENFGQFSNDYLEVYVRRDTFTPSRLP